MQEVSGETVLGRFDGAEIEHFGARTRFFRKGESFFVSAEGPDGQQADFEIKYTFGVEPLQQYLIELPGGRLQALNVAWDARPKSQGGQRWFHLHPDEPVPVGDVLHWTGPASSWNSTCADCHSTNLRKNYSAALNEYDTRWSEIDVACEACHGPGSRHVEWASSHREVLDANKGLLVDLGPDGGNWTMDAATGIATRTKPRDSQTELNTCAPCHSRRAPISADREPDRPLLDSYVPALLEEGLYYADGQIQDEVYVYGSFLQSKMYRAGVTCSDCHDPHSLRVRDGPDAACARCHLPAKFAVRSHHHHAPGSPGSRCVERHMPATTYMVIDVTEFPFDGVNKVIYDENGVVIRSIPAIHGLDGAVSFILDWNGLKFAYSSDTIPNKWWVEHTKGADISIHECFLPATLLVTKQGFAPLEGLTVGTQGHTSPEQFGKVMAMTQPRMAVGYHFFNDFDTEPEVRTRVRKTYDGPLALAQDYMVFNVTKDDLRVRMSAIDEEVWPSPPLKKKNPPDFTKSIPISDFTKSGALAFPEVMGPIYSEVNEIYGTDYQPGFK